ncbi:MAG: peptidylprolyl isomerase [Synechococcus sp. TMED155]|nr:MAG: peptidylprolyl isomerase [Synechococcus sp. TMED155]
MILSTPPVSAAEVYNPQQLSHWGLLRQVRREALIDGCIKDVAPPEPETFKKLLEQWCSQLRIDSPEALQRWQQQQGLTPEQWQAFVARRWRWLNWCEAAFASKLNSHYLERKPQLDQVSYSLLRVSDAALANELYLRIKEAEVSFEDVAAEYSEGPEKAQGGRLGPVPLSQPHPMLAKLLQVSSPAQLWPPKQLESWWIVVRLEELHCAELTDELKQRLALELGDLHLEQLLNDPKAAQAVPASPT